MKRKSKERELDKLASDMKESGFIDETVIHQKSNTDWLLIGAVLVGFVVGIVATTTYTNHTLHIWQGKCREAWRILKKHRNSAGAETAFEALDR